MFHILCLLPPFSLPIQHSTELSYSEVLVCLHTSKLWDWGAAPHPCLSSGVCLASCTEGMFCASDPKGRLESQNCWILERERMSYPQRKCGKVSALCCCSSWGIDRWHLVPREMPCGSLEYFVNTSPCWHFRSFYGKDPIYQGLLF